MAGVLFDQMAAGALGCLRLCGAAGNRGSRVSQCREHPSNPQLAFTLQG